MTPAADVSTLERVLAETGMLRSLRSALAGDPKLRGAVSLPASVAAEYRWQLGQLIADMDSMRVVKAPAPQRDRPPPGNLDRRRLTLSRSDR